MGLTSARTNGLCQGEVHVLIDAVVWEMLAWGGLMSGISISLVFAFSLDRDVELCKPRQQRRNVLICLA